MCLAKRTPLSTLGSIGSKFCVLARTSYRESARTIGFHELGHVRGVAVIPLIRLLLLITLYSARPPHRTRPWVGWLGFF